MTSVTNLSRSEAISLRDSLSDILDNKELNQVQIIHTKGEIVVSRSTDGLLAIVQKPQIDIHDCTDAD